MEQTLYFNGKQRPNVEATEKGYFDDSEFEINLDDVTLIIPRYSAETLFTKMDKELHDETVEKLEEIIEQLKSEIERKDSKISSLEYTVERYERKCG